MGRSVTCSSNTDQTPPPPPAPAPAAHTQAQPIVIAPTSSSNVSSLLTRALRPESTTTESHSCSPIPTTFENEVAFVDVTPLWKAQQLQNVSTVRICASLMIIACRLGRDVAVRLSVRFREPRTINVTSKIRSSKRLRTDNAQMLHQSLRHFSASSCLSLCYRATAACRRALALT